MKPKTETEARPVKEPDPILPIPDAPGNIVRATSRRPPKKDWRFLEGSKKRSQPGRT